MLSASPDLLNQQSARLCSHLCTPLAFGLDDKWNGDSIPFVFSTFAMIDLYGGASVQSARSLSRPLPPPLRLVLHSTALKGGVSTYANVIVHLEFSLDVQQGARLTD